jgi:quinol monooxygenase YgiN
MVLAEAIPINSDAVRNDLPSPEVHSLPEPAGVRTAPVEQPDLEFRINASIRILFQARKYKEALIILGSMIERIKLEEGCLSCRLYQDVHEHRALMLEEIWADEAGLHDHLISGDFRDVLLVMEMASEPPEIRFDRVSDSRGIEAIAEMRMKPDAPRKGKNPLPL